MHCDALRGAVYANTTIDTNKHYTRYYSVLCHGILYDEAYVNTDTDVNTNIPDALRPRACTDMPHVATWGVSAGFPRLAATVAPLVVTLTNKVTNRQFKCSNEGTPQYIAMLRSIRYYVHTNIHIAVA